MTMHERDGAPFFADPREVLRRGEQVRRAGPDHLRRIRAGVLSDRPENINGRPQPPRSPISGKRPHSTQVYLIDDTDEYVDCLQDILEGAKEQGIPADAIVKKSAPAQFEVNLHHVADPIKACDYAVLLKRLIKNIAYDHEMDTTFMAKPYRAGPATVCMCTSRCSTRMATIYSPPTIRWTASRCATPSAACSRTMAASMAFLCPNVNSYRRFGAQFYVPNAPCWGMDNRTVALRVPTDSRTRYASNTGSPVPTPTLPAARRHSRRGAPRPDQQDRAG